MNDEYQIRMNWGKIERFGWENEKVKISRIFFFPTKKIKNFWSLKKKIERQVFQDLEEDWLLSFVEKSQKWGLATFCLLNQSLDASE